MAAALRFAAKRIFRRAVERPPLPPQVVLTAAKELAPRTSHAIAGSSLRWPFRSPAPALLLTKAAGPSSTAAYAAGLCKAAAGSALAGLAVGSLLTLPLYVSIIRLRASRRAAERELREWLSQNERYTRAV